MRGTIAAAVACALGVGCAGQRPKDAKCDSPDVRVYQEAVNQQIHRSWAEHPKPVGVGEALIVFTLAADGVPTVIEVASSHEELAHQAEAALVAAQPFPPPIGPAACLVGTRIRANFRAN